MAAPAARSVRRSLLALLPGAAALQLALLLRSGGAAAAETAADPRSDEPEARYGDPAAAIAAADYAQALARWRTPEQLNAWIGAHFRYDRGRAMQLSETQRRAGTAPPIHAPAAFFAEPSGICVDLSRFAVETLRSVAPQLNARYLMIEFDPLTLSGNVLRRHWVALFERDGGLWALGDSKRPGHLAGPYASAQAFVDDYARYRGRRIVAHAEREGFQRRLRTQAPRQPQLSGPAGGPTASAPAGRP